MYVTRKLEKKINKFLKVPEILAVIGPRQCGKTTLVKKFYNDLKPHSIYLDFEDRQVLEIFETDIKTFEELYIKPYKYIFIDEFQYAKEGGKNLKYLYDFNPGKKIIITGSSTIDISVKAIKFLTGRVFILNLFQFNFEEFLSYRDKDLYNLLKRFKDELKIEKEKILLPEISSSVLDIFYKLYEEFSLYGGYPRVVTTESKMEKIEVLKSIYNIFFLREVKEILNLADDYKLVKLLKVLAIQTGSLISYDDISSISGFNYIQLKRNMNLLEKTFIIKQVQPYFTNKSVEIVKNPKIYFIDCGLRNVILQNFNKINSRTDQGATNENIVFSELYKEDLQINFWRTKSQAEVDFIIEKTGKIIPIEVKSNLKKFVVGKPMYSFMNKYNVKFGLILSDKLIGKKPSEDKNIIFIPSWLSFLKLI